MNTFATKSNSACVSGAGSRRITREQAVTLRNIIVAEKTLTHKITQAFHTCWRDLKVLMNTPIVKVDRHKGMCKYYGHIIDANWEGYFPKCTDCGVEVKSPDQLRKAMPKH